MKAQLLATLEIELGKDSPDVEKVAEAIVLLSSVMPERDLKPQLADMALPAGVADILLTAEFRYESDRWNTIGCIPNLPTHIALRGLKDNVRGWDTKMARFSKDPEVLARILASGDHYARSYLADNPNSPEEYADELARDRHSRVRAAVAQSTKRVDLMTKLAEDREPDVLSALARNPHLTRELQIQLINYDHPPTTIQLLRNTGLHPDAAQAAIAIARDTDYEVLSRLMACRLIPAIQRAEKAAASRSIKVRNSIVKALTTEEMGEILATASDPVKKAFSKSFVRMALA